MTPISSKRSNSNLTSSAILTSFSEARDNERPKSSIFCKAMLARPKTPTPFISDANGPIRKRMASVEPVRVAGLTLVTSGTTKINAPITAKKNNCPQLPAMLRTAFPLTLLWRKASAVRSRNEERKLRRRRR